MLEQFKKQSFYLYHVQKFVKKETELIAFHKDNEENFNKILSNLKDI